MYSTSPGKQPKRPVVGSLTGANREVETWLAENAYDKVRDADGCTWDLKLDATQVPDKGEKSGLVWRLTVRLTTTVTAPELTGSGVLDRKADERLLKLLGEEAVDLSMKPLVYHAPNEEKAKLLIADTLPKLKGNFAQQSLKEIKRALVGRHIDARGAFKG